MKKKKWMRIVLFFVWLLTGCGAVESSEDVGTEVEIIMIEDETGEKEVPLDPERIVVFDMGILDTIRELGLEEKVVGVPKDSLPDYLSAFDNENIENVGTLKEPDFETIHALNPDIVFISGRQQPSMESLAEIASTVLLILDYTDYWSSFESNMQTIGTIFSMENDVEEKLVSLRTDRDELHQLVTNSQLTTLTVLLNVGSLSAYGSQSRFGILNDTFGFQSTDSTIEASTHGQSVSYEYVLNQDPDVLFVIDRTTAFGGAPSQNDLMSNPLIQEITAYQNDHIMYLTPDVWYLSGGGLESVRLMIEEVRIFLNNRQEVQGLGKISQPLTVIRMFSS